MYKSNVIFQAQQRFNTILSTEGLSKSLEEEKIIDKVQMHVPRGAVYELICTSRKTLNCLFQLLTGTLQPDAGHIILNGECSARALREQRRNLGFCIDTHFYPYLTIEQNMQYLCDLRGITDKRKESQRVLQLVHLNHFKSLPSDLNDAQRRLLSLAAALLGHPELIIMINPTEGLETDYAVAVYEVVRTLNRSEGVSFAVGSTMLKHFNPLTTHYGFMNQGRLFAEYSAERVNNICSNEILLRVDQPAKALTVIESALRTTAYTIDGNQLIHIREHSEELQKLSEALFNADLRIYELRVRSLTLYEFYLYILGGSQHV